MLLGPFGPSRPSSSAAGAECARWYALALAAFALASFACGGAASVAATRELDDGASVRTLKTTCFPVVASMALYHSGVSRFAASAVARGAASPALRGAIAVHAPLALAFKRILAGLGVDLRDPARLAGLRSAEDATYLRALYG